METNNSQTTPGGRGRGRGLSLLASQTPSPTPPTAGRGRGAGLISTISPSPETPKSAALESSLTSLLPETLPPPKPAPSTSLPAAPPPSGGRGLSLLNANPNPQPQAPISAVGRGRGVPPTLGPSAIQHAAPTFTKAPSINDLLSDLSLSNIEASPPAQPPSLPVSSPSPSIPVGRGRGLKMLDQTQASVPTIPPTGTLLGQPAPTPTTTPLLSAGRGRGGGAPVQPPPPTAAPAPIISPQDLLADIPTAVEIPSPPVKIEKEIPTTSETPPSPPSEAPVHQNMEIVNTAAKEKRKKRVQENMSPCAKLICSSSKKSKRDVAKRILIKSEFNISRPSPIFATPTPFDPLPASVISGGTVSATSAKTSKAPPGILDLIHGFSAKSSGSGAVILTPPPVFLTLYDQEKSLRSQRSKSESRTRVDEQGFKFDTPSPDDLVLGRGKQVPTRASDKPMMASK